MDLRKLLKVDLGVDLPISGGTGQSREDPIVVVVSDPIDIVRTQMLLLRGLGRGRQIFWRKLQRALLGSEWPGIEQLKIETVQLTRDQQITATENYYFETQMAKARQWQDCPLIAYADANGVLIPYELGWLHFENKTQNKPELGVSLAFGAPGIKATVYVYDSGLSDLAPGTADNRLHAEFDKAAQGILMTSPDTEAWADPEPSPRCRVRYYRSGQDAIDATVLWMTVEQGKFVKARLTWTRDKFIDQVGNGFLRSLADAVAQRHNTSGTFL